MHLRPLLLMSALAFVGACDQCGAPEAAKDGGAPDAIASAASVIDAAPRPSAVDAAAEAAPPTDASSASPVTDAGPSTCRLVWGPAEQPFRGPAQLAVNGAELRVVGNEDGKPHVYTVPIAAPPKVPPQVAVPEAFAAMRWPPCDVAGRFAYCQAKGGAVNRAPLAGGDGKQVAKSRGGTRIAAATLGSDHTVVAYLDTRKTSEGEVLQAFAVLDDGAPTRLSDDGTGASDVHFVQRGEGAVAVYLDARTAMAPVHARTVNARGNELALGSDAVLFVSGPPEPNIDFSVSVGPSGTFVLLPTGKDSIEFGVATIPLGDPPKADVGATWSLYPNGLDPAPIAAAGGYVARLRPLEKAPKSPKIVELGKLDASGTFTSLGQIAEGPRVAHLAMATDSHGTLWILYADPAHTWLERRVCP